MRIPMTGYYLLRWQVLERDNFTCQYCGQFAPNVPLEVDHIVTKEDGGEDIPENLKTACFSCNRGRSALRIRMTRSNHRPEPKPFKYTGWRHAIENRQERILSVIQQYPEGISPADIAEKVNLNRRYVVIVAGRLFHSGKVTRLGSGYNKVLYKAV